MTTTSTTTTTTLKDIDAVCVRGLPPASALQLASPNGRPLSRTVSSASLLLLESLHGATVSSIRDLRDAFFAVSALAGPPRVLFKSCVRRASLNPSWESPFPCDDLTVFVLELYSRPSTVSSRSSVSNNSGHENEYTLELECCVNLNALEYVGRDLADLKAYPAPNGAIACIPSAPPHLFLRIRDAYFRPVPFDSLHVDRPACSVDILERIRSLRTQLASGTDENDVSCPAALISETVETAHADNDAQIRMRQIACLRAEIRMHQRRLDADSTRLHAIEKEITRRRNRLYYSEFDRETAQSLILDDQKKLCDLRVIVKETFRYKSVYTQDFIHSLREIYPINALRQNPSAFFIRRIHLPNSEFSDIIATTPAMEERLSTALGWTAHAVVLISLYIHLPLRYPINPRGSRAMILDRVSDQRAVEFPLFLKGIERVRFDYAVFLLNKNIEQMMNHVGLTPKNLRHTLPNLKAVMDVLAKDEGTHCPQFLDIPMESSRVIPPRDNYTLLPDNAVASPFLRGIAVATTADGKDDDDMTTSIPTEHGSLPLPPALRPSPPSSSPSLQAASSCVGEAHGQSSVSMQITRMELSDSKPPAEQMVSLLHQQRWRSPPPDFAYAENPTPNSGEGYVTEAQSPPLRVPVALVADALPMAQSVAAAAVTATFRSHSSSGDGLFGPATNKEFTSAGPPLARRAQLQPDVRRDSADSFATTATTSSSSSSSSCGSDSSESELFHGGDALVRRFGPAAVVAPPPTPVPVVSSKAASEEVDDGDDDYRTPTAGLSPEESRGGGIGRNFSGTNSRRASANNLAGSASGSVSGSVGVGVGVSGGVGVLSVLGTLGWGSLPKMMWNPFGMGSAVPLDGAVSERPLSDGSSEGASEVPLE
ncbi:hypothetical protein HDU83_007706 [Entophlyctis luteolus]|nr:hypothetical protein HDU83_007706 [Entophlyctis luteolus]